MPSKILIFLYFILKPEPIIDFQNLKFKKKFNMNKLNFLLLKKVYNYTI